MAGLAVSNRRWPDSAKFNEMAVHLRWQLLGASLDPNDSDYALRFYRAIGANQRVMQFDQGDTTNNPNAVDIKNAGSGKGLFIDQNGNGISLDIDSEATTADILNISGATLTTGKGIDLSDLAAITTGKGIHIDATGVTQTSGILVHIDSASTALTSAGRLLLVDHTGASGVSTIIAEVKSAATDETTVAQILASGALAAGTLLNLSGAAVTTGTILKAEGLDALTTGIGLSIESGATAITGAGRLLSVNHSGATTTSGIIAEIITAAADETALLQLKSGGTGNDLTIINTNTGTLGPKIETYHNVGNSAAGDDDVIFRLISHADDEEASATKRQLFSLDVQWTDATAVSYASDLELYLATGAASNLAVTVSGAGQIGVDADSDLSSSSAGGQIFDDYDDVAECEDLAKLAVRPETRIEMLEKFERMGIMSRKPKNRNGWMMNLQPTLKLLMGATYQNRELFENHVARLNREIDELKGEIATLKAA